MPCVVLPLCQLLQRVSEFSVVWRRQRAQDISAGQQQQQAAGGAGEGEHPRRQRRRRVGRPEGSRERREQRPRRGCGIQVRGSNPFLYLPRRGRGSPASTVEAAAAGAMNRSFSRSQNLRFLEGSRLVEVKSKFGAEFRRFSLNRYQPGTYEEFYQCIRQLHQIIDAELMLGYADVHGDLLPINNDDNFVKAVTSAIPLLRVFVQKQEEVDYSNFGTNTLTRRKKALVNLRNDNLRRRPHINISMPHDFRPVSSIIDVDILPETHRRVRLYRHGCEKPLGFYIRDGTSVRVTPQGLEKVPGIFISRMVPGGLADSTGLLAVNDEVLEVNGIEVAGKTLDQVTDMMIANSHNLIITVKPANQRNNIIRSSRTSGSSGQSTDSAASHHSLPPSHALQNFHPDEMESDEEADIVIEGVLEPLHIPKSHSLQSNSLSRLNGTTLSQRLQREMAHNYSGRESNGSMHKILSSLKSDPRHSLVIPRGGIEEDGTVITL